jgi:starch synthase
MEAGKKILKESSNVRLTGNGKMIKERDVIMIKVLHVLSGGVSFLNHEGIRAVSDALPIALKKKNVDVRIVMPSYQEIPETIRKTIKWQESIHIPVGWKNQYCGLEHTVYENVPFYFLSNKGYFNRPDFWGFQDDAERFAFFNRAALEMLPFIDFQPDVIHCHDWQTGMVPVLHKITYQQNTFYRHMKTVFTIHNLKEQGCFPPNVLREYFNLGTEYLTSEGLEFYGKVNYLKGGISYSDQITTDSPAYARKIQSPDYGEGLDGLLRRQCHKLKGVLSGFEWDQCADAYLEIYRELLRRSNLKPVSSLT